MFHNLLKNKLLQNFSHLAVAEVAAKVMTFLVILHVGRLLGPANYGKLSFAMAIVSFFMLLVGMGMSTIGLREVAREHGKGPSIVSNIVAMRLVMFVPVYALLMLTAHFLGPEVVDPLTFRIIAVYGLIMLVNPENFEWYLVARENFRLLAASRIVHGLAYVALTYLLIRSSDQVLDFTILQVAVFLVPLAIIGRAFAGELKARLVSLRMWPGLLRSGFFLMSALFMASMYNNMDKIMIGLWYPDTHVGWYDAAFRITMVTQVLCTLLWNLFSPRLVRREARDIKTYVVLMVASGLVVALGIGLLSRPIILLVFGESFLPSVGVLAVLSASIFMLHLCRAVVSPLFLWNRERLGFNITLASCLLNLVLNLILIPFYGMIGAAVATVATYLGQAAMGLPHFLRECKLPGPQASDA